MANVNVQALVRNREEDRGSDETSLQKRRRIQQLIRTGDEQVIPELVSSLSEYLKSPQKIRLPAAIASAKGLGQLCDPCSTQTRSYLIFRSETKMTPEQLLLHALEMGNNRLQSAAADALGHIGTQQLSLDDLQEREKHDKSASVRARCTMAIRRMAARNRSTDFVLTDSQIETLIHRACTNTYIDIETNEHGAINDDGKFVATIKIQPPKNVEGQDRTKNVRTQRVEITICEEKRELKTGIKRNIQYLSISTICGAAQERLFKPILSLNAMCLSPKDIKHDYQFTQGALAVSNNKLMLIQTISTANLTSDFLQVAIIAIANNGDELEKFLYRGADSN